MPELLAANAALLLLEKLLPILEEQLKRGEITEGEQLLVRNRYLALRAKADALFIGPHWHQSAPTPIPDQPQAPV